MKELVKLIVLIILGLVCGFCFGIYYEQEDYKEQVPIVDTIWAVSKSEIELRDFESIEELETWLEDDDTDSHIILIADEEGYVSFEGVCEDYAIQLMDRAIADGFKMSFYVMDRQEYYQHFKKWTPKGRLHAVNLVIIGNEIYLIEPQSDEYWLKAYLD